MRFTVDSRLEAKQSKKAENNKEMPADNIQKDATHPHIGMKISSIFQEKEVRSPRFQSEALLPYQLISFAVEQFTSVGLIYRPSNHPMARIERIMRESYYPSTSATEGDDTLASRGNKTIPNLRFAMIGINPYSLC
jgi:hypothetical protein